MESALPLLDGDWNMLCPLGEITSRMFLCQRVSACHVPGGSY